MGCNVHMVIEYDRYSEWEALWLNGKTVPTRDTKLYSIMAGVRDDNNIAIYQTRGLPEDATKLSKHLFSLDKGFHHSSWLTYDEFENCINNHPNCDIEYKCVLYAMKALIDNRKKCRLVFWFDN